MAQTQAQFMASNPGATAADYSAYWAAQNPTKAAAKSIKSTVTATDALVNEMNTAVAAAKARTTGGQDVKPGTAPLDSGSKALADAMNADLAWRQQQAAAEAARYKVSAKASLRSWLETFFDSSTDSSMINSLMSFVEGQISEDIPTEAIMLNIRSQPFYQQRFSANAELRKKGLAELSPEEYLSAERTYSSLLTTSGLSTLSNRTTFNKLISGEVSATELQDRITNVYDRINNADTALQGELNKFFDMGLGKSDLAAALLTGSEGANTLKRKITMAEIGAEFTPRGLTSQLGVEELANLGVTRDTARRGAEYAATGMRNLTDLANIYGAQTSGLQAELEKEAFAGLESKRRKQLTEAERAAFSGQSGTGSPSFGRSSAGSI